MSETTPTAASPDPQFAVTAWPGALPRPETPRTTYEWVLGEDGVLVPIDGWFLSSDNPPPLEAPRLNAKINNSGRRLVPSSAPDRSAIGELYLDLIQLDLSDDAAIADFVARFGVLGITHRRFGLVRELPGLREHTIPALAASWPSAALRQTTDDYAQLRGAANTSTLVETLDEFRFGVRVLRDLHTATLLATGHKPPQEITFESIPANVLSDKLEDLEWLGVDTPTTAIDDLLRRVLGHSLTPFHPRIEYADRNPFEIEPQIPLYAICCLEIFNHFAEHAQHRTCANETCQRLFVRQQGRATHGQHRSTGIKYCSTQCARAQAQRTYRRRTTPTPTD